MKSFDDDVVLEGLSEGVVVYRKNNQPEADFWKNMCREILYLNEKGRFLSAPAAGFNAKMRQMIAKTLKRC